jgi:hypothetical protein
MPVCTKCNIDKPIEQYSLDKQKNKVYRKKYCIDCFRQQSRDYKIRKRLERQIPQEEKITQPVVLELEPEVVTIPDNHKQCSDCMVYKPLDKFYLNKNGHQIKRCKECHVIMNRKKSADKMEMNGGRDLYYKEPNRYIDEQQKTQVFMVMEAIGWIFDESTGVWNRPGLKENGVFINFTPSNKKKRHTGNITGRKIKSGVWNNTDKIVKLIEEGYTYYDVAETFDCSHTTIRKVISEYRNGSN